MESSPGFAISSLSKLLKDAEQKRIQMSRKGLEKLEEVKGGVEIANRGEHLCPSPD